MMAPPLPLLLCSLPRHRRGQTPERCLVHPFDLRCGLADEGYKDQESFADKFPLLQNF